MAHELDRWDGTRLSLMCGTDMEAYITNAEDLWAGM